MAEGQRDHRRAVALRLDRGEEAGAVAAQVGEDQPGVAPAPEHDFAGAVRAERDVGDVAPRQIEIAIVESDHEAALHLGTVPAEGALGHADVAPFGPCRGLGRGGDLDAGELRADSAMTLVRAHPGNVAADHRAAGHGRRGRQGRPNKSDRRNRNGSKPYHGYPFSLRPKSIAPSGGADSRKEA